MEVLPIKNTALDVASTLLTINNSEINILQPQKLTINNPEINILQPQKLTINNPEINTLQSQNLTIDYLSDDNCTSDEESVENNSFDNISKTNGNGKKKTIEENKLKLYDVIIIDGKDYFTDEYNLIYDEYRTIVGVNSKGKNILYKQIDSILKETKKGINIL